MIIFSVSQFDVDEPEGSGKSSYMSKKDVRLIAFIMVVLIGIMIPIYSSLRETRNQHLCYQNLTQISKAIGVYSAQNDDRLPPAYVNDSEAPMVDTNGHPYTWESLIVEDMNTRSASFVCDSAHPLEESESQHPESSKKTIGSTYGMYGVYSGYPISHISNPDEAVLIAETSNVGAAETYDPVPFIGKDGKPMKQDGFLIGFSNSNDAPNKDTTAITRLAFPGTNKGLFERDGRSRHKDGIYFMTVAGKIELEKPTAAKLRMLPGGSIQGGWGVPPQFGQ